MNALSPILKRVLDRRPSPLAWPPLKIGHRGAAGEAPENTMASFDLGWRQGVDGIEFDVQLSSDDVPMVIHDARLARTTSGNGWVWEHRASVLRRLDAGSWFNRRYRLRARERYAGARIPLLAEVLQWVKTRQCLAFIELKDYRPGGAARVLQEIERAGVWHLTRVVSFDLPSLQQARNLSGQAHLGLDFSGRLLPIRRALALGAEALLPHWAIASRGLIRRAHRAGLQVIPWTVNYPLHMRRKILDGVDGLISNYPARLTEALETIERARAEGKG
ncbi:MAG: glycerophosphodiester phosphodiesterase family protein [Terriglobia bacterium]